MLFVPPGALALLFLVTSVLTGRRSRTAVCVQLGLAATLAAMVVGPLLLAVPSLVSAYSDSPSWEDELDEDHDATESVTVYLYTPVGHHLVPITHTYGLPSSGPCVTTSATTSWCATG